MPSCDACSKPSASLENVSIIKCYPEYICQGCNTEWQKFVNSFPEYDEQWVRANMYTGPIALIQQRLGLL